MIVTCWTLHVLLLFKLAKSLVNQNLLILLLWTNNTLRVVFVHMRGALLLLLVRLIWDYYFSFPLLFTFRLYLGFNRELRLKWWLSITMSRLFINATPRILSVDHLTVVRGGWEFSLWDWMLLMLLQFLLLLYSLVFSRLLCLCINPIIHTDLSELNIVIYLFLISEDY